MSDSTRSERFESDLPTGWYPAPKDGDSDGFLFVGPDADIFAPDLLAAAVAQTWTLLRPVHPDDTDDATEVTHLAQVAFDLEVALSDERRRVNLLGRDLASADRRFEQQSDTLAEALDHIRALESELFFLQNVAAAKNAQPCALNGYTQHGHPIEGVTQTGTPNRVNRCGGPLMCALCSRDAKWTRGLL